ncbi:helix-turn-helix domain-containing protein [Streptomyces globisporus]|uniref:helix-turn-helix domain-containing protein n=1 Tax=Streptomyces globisporus TaxID=1908 RepID=UPI003701A4CA
MIGTVFRTDDVPTADRFDYWSDLVGLTRPSSMSTVHAENFRAELLFMELGSVKVWPTTVLPTRYRLGAKRARQVDTGLYHLTLLLSGGLALDRSGESNTFGPSDLHMVDDSEAFDLRPANALSQTPVTGVGVDIPKALLPLPEHRVRPLLGRGISGRTGVGALLTEFLSGLTRQAKVLTPSDAIPMGAVVVDLVSACLAQELGTDSQLPQSTRREALLRQIEAFISQHLHHPDLTPRMVAAAHHISVSYLHRLYEQQEHGETVAARIRRKRLEGARCDLVNDSTTPIYEIGAKWGFRRASEFSRAFKSAFGLSPREYRVVKKTQAKVDLLGG